MQIVAFLVLGVVVLGVAYAFVVRPWHLRRGSTKDEVQRSLPGDELVPNPKFQWNQAVTIHAPAAEVWPWLVQIGNQRAGWYSWDGLHRLMGVAGSVDDDRGSANRIIPELQDLKVGDSINIAAPMGYQVTAVEPNQVLLLHAGVNTATGQPFDPAGSPPDRYVNSSWVWFLDRVDDETTRLIARFRQDFDPSVFNVVVYHLTSEMGFFIMERKTLLGIKQRAERGGTSR